MNHISSLGKLGSGFTSAIRSSSTGQPGAFNSMMWDKLMERRDIDNIKISHKDQAKKTDSILEEGRFLSEIDSTVNSIGIFEAKDSTENDPVVIVRIDNKEGEIYREQIHVKDVDPTHATFLEMEAVLWTAQEDTFDWTAYSRILCFFDSETCFERQDFLEKIQNKANIELGAGQLEVRQGFVNLYKGYAEYCKQYLSEQEISLFDSLKI